MTDSDSLRSDFAALLGLDEPISEDALWAIAADPTYARRLFACRSAPRVMRLMLENLPPRPKAQTVPSTLASAALALTRWAGAGFATLSEDDVRRRLDACAHCPRRVTPRSVLQNLVALTAADDGVCGLCGCNVAHKARMSTERCPDVDPADPSRNRWGQKMAAPP